ncbi:MAG: DNA primase [Candidatus Heimdallarchaeota archaeon]|nr:DNA primase [Candidatus Heimdallarchaeota archaeon]
MADNNHNNNIQTSEESTTTKYMIHADFMIDGVVEKPDVVGALFGQTEGLLSDDLELRELQKSGRVGRIQVSLLVRGGKTKGSIFVPSSLDKVETSILAAAIETVDRIGPCNANISIRKIEDVREEKRKKIIERASDLLKRWDSQVSQESSEIHDEVIKAARVGGITQFGNLPAGPELNDSDTIIVVEGRADINACLRAGVRNTIAVDGANVPKVVSDLTRKKTTIAFLDGDRGGDLILKELLMYGYIDFVARAPVGKEVEDLKPKEIVEQLSKKLSIEQAGFITEIHADEILEKAIKKKQSKTTSKAITTPTVTPIIQQPQAPTKEVAQRKPVARGESTVRNDRSPQRSSSQSRDERRPQSRTGGRPQQRDGRRPQTRERREYVPREAAPRVPDELIEFVKEIDGKEKQEGIFLDEKHKKLKTILVSDIYDEIKKTKDKVNKVIFDGIITQRLIDVCEEKEINVLVGARIAEIEKPSNKVKVFIFA